MIDEVRDLLVDELKTEIEKLSTLKPGSNEHKAAVESIEKLYKLNIEETKNEREFMEKCDRDLEKERDWKLKNAQLKAQKWDLVAKYGLQVLTFAGGLAYYAYWLTKGFKFEEEGTWRSPTNKMLKDRCFKFLK